MIILDFSHPLAPEHLAQLERLVGEAVERVVEVAVQIEADRSLAPQVVDAVDRAGLTPREWQTLPLVVNLPGYAPAAAALLAELHGRMGHFPSVLWFSSVAGSTPLRFTLAQIVNLQAVRDAARLRRKE